MNLTAVPSSAASLVAAGEAEKLPLLPYIPELIFGFVMVGIVYLVVARKVVPTMERTFAERRAAIEGGIEEAGRAQAEARAALEQYQAQLAGARGEAHEIREAAREQAAALMVEMRTQAQAEAARITEHAQRQIEAERQQAVALLRLEIGTLSTSLASKIVGESLEDDARRTGVVDRFLAELESGDVRPEKVAPVGRDA
ncbi:MAG: F0F1 ATP synthase subunit B [Dermatophilaceae bacterium]